MKRLGLLLLILCLLLCACGRRTAEGTTTSPETTNPTTVTQPEEETTGPTTAPSTPTESQCTEIRHPLNGALLEEPWTGRVMAVSINNYVDARPQYGINDADILYEFETEGGITRRLGLYSDVSATDRIGPIRSARTFFLNTAAAYDAVLVHCGGSVMALQKHYDMAGNTLAKWDHVDAMTNSRDFFRDTERQKNGYAYEHTLFTTGKNLERALTSYGYEADDKSRTEFGLRFAEEPVLNGESAEELTIAFRAHKKTTATYNEEIGRYEISQYDDIDIDANTNEKLTVRNVVVVFATQHISGVSSFYEMIGSGEGYFACDGQIIPIKWTRSSVEDPFIYTTKDGEPVTLGVGNSYIAVIDGSVKYQ